MTFYLILALVSWLAVGFLIVRFVFLRTLKKRKPDALFRLCSKFDDSVRKSRIYPFLRKLNL